AYVFSPRTLKEVHQATQRAGTKTRDYGSFEKLSGFWIPRKNFFLGRWMKHGGFYPDPKLRLVRRGKAFSTGRDPHDRFEMKNGERVGRLKGALIHHTYPTLNLYLEHMNRYSS